MYLRIIDVAVKEGYKLLLTFENKENRVLDMSEYLDKGLYNQLKDKALFRTAKVSFDTVEWANEIDVDPEFVYEESVPVH